MDALLQEAMAAWHALPADQWANAYGLRVVGLAMRQQEGAAWSAKASEVQSKVATAAYELVSELQAAEKASLAEVPEGPRAGKVSLREALRAVVLYRRAVGAAKARFLAAAGTHMAQLPPSPLVGPAPLSGKPGNNDATRAALAALDPIVVACQALTDDPTRTLDELAEEVYLALGGSAGKVDAVTHQVALGVLQGLLESSVPGPSRELVSAIADRLRASQP